MTQLSDNELAQGNIDLWYSWLRAGLITFKSDDPVATRYRAFAPLVVDPQSGNPAGDIVQQIRTIPVERTGVVEAAAIEALRNWSLAADGWEPAALLISVSARLGGRGVADAVWGLIARSGDMPADARAELAYLAVQAAMLRYKFTEIVSLIELLWSEELATPQLLGMLAVLLSRKDHGGLGMMPVQFAKIMPALVETPHSGDFVRVISSELRQSYGPEDLVKAFQPRDGEDLKVADFRRVLLSLSRGKNVFVLPVSQASRERAESRLAGMEKLSGSEDLADLQPPLAPKGGVTNDGADRS